MKRIFILVLLSFCFINLGFAQRSGVIDPELYDLMNSRSGDKISVNIVLKKQIDADALNVRKSFSSKEAKRTYMVEEMKYQAEKDQADVLKTLQASERSSQVTDINCHWLTNMINCNATADAILKIAEHPDVESIIYNKLEKLIPDTKAKPTSAVRGNTQNITQIQADKVWGLGFTGKDVIVAVIDSGVNTDHVDLKDHLWSDSQGRHGKNTLDNNYDITDNDGHGTHCAGTICGDGTSGTTTGMAPDATLMCIKALDVDYSDPSGPQTVGTVDATISAVEYAVENGADILSMSLGFSYPGPGVNEIMRELFSNTLTAGVVASVAAGNDGRSSVLAQYPVPRNINAPGNCPPPYLSPDQEEIEIGGTTSVICIGAVNYSDEACDFSSQGPVSWENTIYADYPYGTAIPTTTLRYDNGNVSSYYTFTNTFAVKFPTAMLTGFGTGGNLSAVTIFDVAQTSGTFKILEGGNDPSKGKQVHSQTFTLSASGDMIDIALNKTLTVNTAKDLWVVFELGTNVVPIASNEDDANGRWVYVNKKWTNTNIPEMLAVRAKVTTSNTAETHYGLIRPDVVAPGYQIVSASNASNTGYATMNGTSMATPCAAGAMALLLDANPNLTPAQICKALETTAVKLSETKSNKTGTGRINIYDAVLSVAGNIPLSAPTLTATAASTSSINLSWTTAPGATSYTVYRGDSQIASVTTTSYSDNGLNPETQYCYTVKAIKGSESATSTQVCATTLAESSGQQYRIRVSTTSHEKYGKYLYVNSYTLPSDNTPTLLVGNYAESNTQIFTLEDAGNGKYYLRTADGYYVKCGTTSIGKYWNTYAYSVTEKTPLTLQYVDDVNFYIRDYDKTTGTGHSTAMPNNNYFKVETGKIYCDAPSTNTDVVTWVFELVGGTTPEPEPEPEPDPTPGGGNGECKIIFTLTDSWGDGWNDAYIYIYGNNIDEVIDFQNPGNREIKTKTHTLSIPQGTVINGELYTGLYPNEIGLTIAYEGGENIYTIDSSNGFPSKETKTILSSYTVDCGASTPTPTVPSAPTNLTATAQSTSAIKLTWDAVDGAASYNVYRGETKITNVATGTTYTNTGLSADTQYCYTVTAVNNAGESAESNEACARTQAETPTVPNAPTLAAAAQSTTAIGLTWTSVPGATSYKIYKGGSYLTTVATGTTYSDTGLTPNTQYCYKVTAVNNVGESAYSNEACATTQAENTGGDDGGDDGDDDGGVISIGTPPYKTGVLPINTLHSYGYSQQIYTKAEIDPDGSMVGSKITKIAFKQANDVVTTRNIVVYMQNTVKEKYGYSAYDWTNEDDSHIVFSGNITTPGKDKSLEITLDTPLIYTGGGLLISVFDKTGTDVSQAQFYQYETSYRSLRASSFIPAGWGGGNPYNPASMRSVEGEQLGQNNTIDITLETVVPVPQNVKATPYNIFVDQSTIISWDACNGVSSYNLYVNGVKHNTSPITSTSYGLSNLPYDVSPGVKINVTAVANKESEMSENVLVKVAAYFPLEINVVDAQGNPMQDVVVDLDGHDELGNVISQTYTSDANGNITVEKMPIPLFNNCYEIVATKSVYKGYASICDYNDPPMNVEKDVRYVLTIVMELPVPELSSNKNSYTMNENIVLNWEWRETLPAGVNPSGYNLYEKYWDERSSSYIYEKINTSLIPANQMTYTVTGGLPFRGCDNTICLTVDYSGSETSKDLSTVTVTKTGYGTMDGIVVDGNGNPVSGVTVTVKGKDCAGNAIPDYTYTTGANGKFGESNMPMGIYTILAAPPQNSAYNDRYVYNVEIVHDNTTTVVIELWEGGEAIEVEREIGESPAPYIDADGPMLPVSNSFLYSASQQIYTREELNFASATDVKITSISFKVYGNENKGSTDYIRIFMQNIDKDEFEKLNDWTSFSIDDIYFDNTYKMPADGEWVTFTFTKPFSYTGGNLIVGAHRHYDPLQNQTNFYVCETETMRSLCACDPTFDPITMNMDGTALYKINNIKITYTSTSPEVVITPDPIEFGEVIVGDYWREKPDVTVPVQIESYNSEVESVTIDEPFFTLPALSLPEDDLLEFEMGYDRINGTPGSKYGIMTVTPNKGVVKGVKVTATAYDPVEPDVFEKSREVVWVDDEYEDTPDFATLHDDYILPGENPEGTRFDAVYKFTLDEDATLTAEVLNGSNPLIAFYKENFANDNVDKDGPSSDNYYYYGTTSVVEGLSFPAGTYYAVPAAETNFTFRLTRSNDLIIFIGQGDWKVPSNWNINSVPVATDDVIIRGDAHVNDGVYINSIFIESVGTLTVEPTGTLDVIGGIENNLHSAFIIEDGGQVYQNNANVAATFNMNINNPATWGPDGSNHANGWQFIASPFVDADLLGYVNPDEGGDYDLYKYDGTRHLEWVNYKLHHDEFIHDFADGMQGWTSLDANGDGYTWSYNGGAGKDGAAGYLSCVFNSGASNDYLVSPKIINTYPESKLRFWVKNASNVTTSSEVEVWLSADKAASPTAAGDFVTKVGTVTVTNEWQQVEFLLEAYADQDDRDFMEYWIAIRCTSGASANAGVMVDHLELANYEEANPYETEFVLGRGYMASYESDGEATIQGALNHERTFNYKVAFNADDRWENFYLIGNPFPFNIKWTDFTHSNIVNGFAVVDNDGSYVYDVNADIKVGDGIMIMTTGANPSVSVSKGTRNKVADYLNVVASGSEGDDNFIISLSGDEYDGFKKLENFNDEISQVYVAEYGTHYGIVNRDEDVEEVEFCFDVKKMGSYTITVQPSCEFSTIVLYDRVEEVETDMLADKAYKFLARNAENNFNRFVLKFAKKSDVEDNFVYQSGDELVIDADGIVQIVDVMGRIIYSGEQSGINRVNVRAIKNSACVVRNINNNEVRTQKIVIL